MTNVLFNESCEVTSQLTVCTDSRVSHACAGYLLMIDTLQQLTSLGNDGKIITSCHADYRREPSSKQYKMVVSLAEVNQLKLHRIQIGEEAGRMIFTPLSELDEGQGICFTFCSLHHSSKASQSDFFNTNHFYIEGYQLDRLCRHLVTSSLNGLTSFMLAEAPSLQSCNGSQWKGSWSSLHELILWMIKDKLDIFDNWRFAAVCRDWWSASVQYPKNLYSVGDGVPWLWRTSKYLPSSSREFVSAPRKSKFVVDMPELSECIALFSKQGWILLRRKAGCLARMPSEPVCIVNPLARAKIELPVVNGMAMCSGSFTTRDGYPERVFLIISTGAHNVTIKTAYPGDEVWTDHNYSGLERPFVAGYEHITIGSNVYCRDRYSYITVFNVANNSVKVLPHVSRIGFIAEHGGRLIYVDGCGVDEDRFGTFSLHKYNDYASSWERLSKSAVMDTSWYLCRPHSCITARESGLKVYELERIRVHPPPGRPLRRFPVHKHEVVVYDLVTGSRTTLPDSYPGQRNLSWIAIG